MRALLLAVCGSLLALAGFSTRAQAAVTPAFSFPAVRAPHPMALDPSLADPAWQLGKVPDGDVWKDVTTRGNAPDVTTAYFLYDDVNLYVAFVAPQRAPIVATQTTNDVGFGTDDFVAVGVDTSGAGSQAYLFETTPRGVRYQQATENVRYRPDWKAAGKVVDGEWRAVMIIPLSSMRIHGGSNVWRIGFFRGVAATAEHYTWAFDGLMPDAGAGNWPSFNDLRFWPSVTIALAKSNSARPEPRLEVYALSSSGEDRSDYEQADGTFYPQPTRYYGADVSVPVTSTINLVGTLNPDFSNVEIDQQTIAPQEFQRQLIEYRPFFAQGAQYLDPNPNGYSNYISYPNEVFYSPSVGPFDSGAKIEGVYGQQSFGVLTFQVTMRKRVRRSTIRPLGGSTRRKMKRCSITWTACSRTTASTATTTRWKRASRAATCTPRSSTNSTTRSSTARGCRKAPPIPPTASSTNIRTTTKSTSATSTSVRTTIDRRLHRKFRHPRPEGFMDFNGTAPGVKSWTLFFVGDRFHDQSGAIHEADTGAYLSAVFHNLFSFDGIGPTVSLLRQYSIPYTPTNCALSSANPFVGTSSFTGFSCYLQGTDVPYNLMAIPIGYRDGSPTPIDVAANWGSLGGTGCTITPRPRRARSAAKSRSVSSTMAPTNAIL